MLQCDLAMRIISLAAERVFHALGSCAGERFSISRAHRGRRKYRNFHERYGDAHGNNAESFFSRDGRGRSLVGTAACRRGHEVRSV